MECANCPFGLVCYTNSWGKGSRRNSNNYARYEVLFCRHCGFMVMQYFDANTKTERGKTGKRWLFNCKKRQFTKRYVLEELGGMDPKYKQPRHNEGFLPDPLGGFLYVVTRCTICLIGESRSYNITDWEVVRL